MAYCSSLSCSNLVCHPHRTLCLSCDVTHLQCCECQCNCYTQITMLTLKSILVERTIKKGCHSNILVEKKAIFDDIEEKMSKLENVFSKFKRRGEMLRWVANTCGIDTFYNKVVGSRNIQHAKLIFLINWATFAYFCHTGEFFTV